MLFLWHCKKAYKFEIRNKFNIIDLHENVYQSFSKILSVFLWFLECSSSSCRCIVLALLGFLPLTLMFLSTECIVWKIIINTQKYHNNWIQPILMHAFQVRSRKLLKIIAPGGEPEGGRGFMSNRFPSILKGGVTLDHTGLARFSGSWGKSLIGVSLAVALMLRWTGLLSKAAILIDLVLHIYPGQWALVVNNFATSEKNRPVHKHMLRFHGYLSRNKRYF